MRTPAATRAVITNFPPLRALLRGISPEHPVDPRFRPPLLYSSIAIRRAPPSRRRPPPRHHRVGLDSHRCRESPPNPPFSRIPSILRTPRAIPYDDRRLTKPLIKVSTSCSSAPAGSTPWRLMSPQHRRPMTLRREQPHCRPRHILDVRWTSARSTACRCATKNANGLNRPEEPLADPADRPLPVMSVPSGRGPPGRPTRPGPACHAGGVHPDRRRADLHRRQPGLRRSHYAPPTLIDGRPDTARRPAPSRSGQATRLRACQAAICPSSGRNENGRHRCLLETLGTIRRIMIGSSSRRRLKTVVVEERWRARR